LWVDAHGDEELPHIFFAGSQGAANWGPRLAELYRLVSPLAPLLVLRLVPPIAPLLVPLLAPLQPLLSLLLALALPVRARSRALQAVRGPALL